MEGTRRGWPSESTKHSTYALSENETVSAELQRSAPNPLHLFMDFNLVFLWDSWICEWTGLSFLYLLLGLHFFWWFAFSKSWETVFVLSSYILLCYVLMLSLLNLLFSNEGWKSRSEQEGSGEQLVGVERGETEIRIYYMKNKYFNKVENGELLKVVFIFLNLISCTWACTHVGRWQVYISCQWKPEELVWCHKWSVIQMLRLKPGSSRRGASALNLVIYFYLEISNQRWLCIFCLIGRYIFLFCMGVYIDFFSLFFYQNFILRSQLFLYIFVQLQSDYIKRYLPKRLFLVYLF